MSYVWQSANFSKKYLAQTNIIKIIKLDLLSVFINAFK